MSAGTELRGTDQIGEVVRRKLLRVSAAVAGVRVSVIPATQRRGAEENALIARVQKERGRNPFYLSREDRRVIAATGRAMGRSDTVARFNMFKAIGDYMLEAVRRNFIAQRNPNGSPFKALSKNYANFKQRKYGFKVPILEASKELVSSLRVRIDRIRS